MMRSMLGGRQQPADVEHVAPDRPPENGGKIRLRLRPPDAPLEVPPSLAHRRVDRPVAFGLEFLDRALPVQEEWETRTDGRGGDSMEPAAA